MALNIATYFKTEFVGGLCSCRCPLQGNFKKGICCVAVLPSVIVNAVKNHEGLILFVMTWRNIAKYWRTCLPLSKKVWIKCFKCSLKCSIDSFYFSYLSFHISKKTIIAVNYNVTYFDWHRRKIGKATGSQITFRGKNALDMYLTQPNLENRKCIS